MATHIPVIYKINYEYFFSILVVCIFISDSYEIYTKNSSLEDFQRIRIVNILILIGFMFSYKHF